jgi:hypothetical protein
VPDVTVTPVPDRLAAFLAARRAELASQVVEMTAADL